MASRVRACTSIGVALLLLSPVGVHAQPVDVGSRVRITSEWYQLNEAIGLVRASTRDSLRVAFQGGDVSRDLALGRLGSIEVSEGYRRRTLRGLAIGSLVGVAVGFVIGVREGDDRGAWVTGGESVALGVGLFGGAGALVGLAVGSAVRTESWRPVAF